MNFYCKYNDSTCTHSASQGGKVKGQQTFCLVIFDAKHKNIVFSTYRDLNVKYETQI